METDLPSNLNSPLASNFKQFKTKVDRNIPEMNASFDNLYQQLAHSSEATGDAFASIQKLAQSPELTAIYSLIPRILHDVSEMDLNVLAAHIMALAKNESGDQWFPQGNSTHFGLLQQSQANWNQAIKTVKTALSNSNQTGYLYNLAQMFGIPPAEVQQLEYMWGRANSTFYQIPAITGAAVNNYKQVSSQFKWNGNAWTPKLRVIEVSPNWTKFKQHNSDLLKSPIAGLAALLSLVHINGPSWYAATKIAHPHRYKQDALLTAETSSTPLSTEVTAAAVNSTPFSVARGKTAIKVNLSPAPSSGWLEPRGNSVHTGIDYPLPLKTKIIAPADGTITTLRGGPTNRAGYYLDYATSDGFVYRLMHLDYKTKGVAHNTTSNVKAGDLIGFSGSSGKRDGHGHSYRPHLHISVFPPAGFLDLRKGAFYTVPRSKVTFYNPELAPIQPLDFIYSSH